MFKLYAAKPPATLLRWMQEADVIVYDRLVSPEVMRLARTDAEKINAQFNKGVLLVHLPKRAEAIHPEKVIPIKSGK